ncbi:MAG: hypothetical protein ACI4OP_02340 [Candidatus Coprovivens sp.]
MKFMYNGRIYNPVNVEKKLKKMGITMDDIEIIPVKEEVIEYDDIKTYKFINKNTSKYIVSIYDNLDDLKDLINVNDYEKVRKED